MAVQYSTEPHLLIIQPPLLLFGFQISLLINTWMNIFAANLPKINSQRREWIWRLM